MKVLAIGGTGFVGLGLTERLLSAGHQVMILSRDRRRSPVLDRTRISFPAADRQDKDVLRSARRGPHLRCAL
jgi:nucleoside-diphosphate-sugar epimerase